jgi:type IV secretory pathway VirB2 component (pilin)
LNGEKAADLLEKSLELLVVEVRIPFPFQAPASFHHLFQQGQPLTALGPGGQIPAEQIQNSIRSQPLQVALKAFPQLWPLAHALQQLQGLLEGLGGGFIAALMVVFLGAGQARQARQQGEVRFAAAAQGRSLGGLKAPGGQFKTVNRLAGLQEKQQPRHLPWTWDIQGWHYRVAGGV